MNSRFLRCAAPLVIGAGILLAAKVSTDYDRRADFTRYHTYSWLKVQANNSLWDDRIMRDVDAQLSAKGWTKVQSGGDAAVAAVGATQNKQTMQTFYNGLGPGWGWRGWGGDGIATTTVENQKVGTLIVDIYDANTKKLLWRGTAQDVLSDKPEKNEKKLADAVEEMFKHFPPQSKG